jgi:eukaryotic-like serine/threonine-protein kinase
MASSSPQLPELGDAIAERFELRRVVGEGGMGIVYEAFDRRAERPCAIKILYPHFCAHPQVIARFDREAQIAAKLKGPNVARVFEVGALPTGLRYIAMELLVGRDLAAEMKERGRLPVALAVDVVMQVAEAMDEAHAVGVVHRDLKPENVFLVAADEARADGRPIVKVLDFGISRLVHGNENLTADYTQLGTALYMSPEQIEAASRVDKRTDVWSLGVVLYEMLVGRPPFEGEGTGILVAIVTRPVPPPSTLRDDLPRGLEAVMMRALEKSPDARFQNMRELARALEPWAPRGGMQPARRWRTRVLMLGLAAAVVVGVAAISLSARSTLNAAPATPPTSAPPASTSVAPAPSRPPVPSIRRVPATRGSTPKGTKRP